MKHQCYFTHLLPLVVIVASCHAFAPSKNNNYHHHHISNIRSNSITKVEKSTRLYISAPEVIVGVVVTGFAIWLYIDGYDDRKNQKLRQEQEMILQKYQEERARKAYIEPKEYWTEEELTAYTGENDKDGPILLAADGIVFNVYKGRNFYGPGGEYHIFAGKDATRYLAKTIVEEETDEEKKQPLSMSERAALAGWMFTLKNKYDIVGKLKDFNPSTTSMKDGFFENTVLSSWNDPRKQ